MRPWKDRAAYDAASKIRSSCRTPSEEGYRGKGASGFLNSERIDPYLQLYVQISNASYRPSTPWCVVSDSVY